MEGNKVVMKISQSKVERDYDEWQDVPLPTSLTKPDPEEHEVEEPNVAPAADDPDRIPTPSLFPKPFIPFSKDIRPAVAPAAGNSEYSIPLSKAME